MFTAIPPKHELLALVIQQAKMFEANNLAYCEVLVKDSFSRHLLLRAYNSLVRRQKITAYEDLLQPEMQVAREMTLDIAKGRLSNKELRELAKALLAIAYFLNLEKN
jgi:hypothetical protein